MEDKWYTRVEFWAALGVAIDSQRATVLKSFIIFYGPITCLRTLGNRTNCVRIVFFGTRLFSLAWLWLLRLCDWNCTPRVSPLTSFVCARREWAFRQAWKDRVSFKHFSSLLRRSANRMSTESIYTSLNTDGNCRTNYSNDCKSGNATIDPNSVKW